MVFRHNHCPYRHDIGNAPPKLDSKSQEQRKKPVGPNDSNSNVMFQYEVRYEFISDLISESLFPRISDMMPPIFIGFISEFGGNQPVASVSYRNLAGTSLSRLPTYVLNLEDFSTLVCTSANRYLPHVGADYTTFFYAVPSTYLYLPQVQPKVDYIY
jgi:hypothetical protein